MSPTKERLTVTLDPDLVKAGNEAVSEGRADSLSAWVNVALAERAAKDRRLRALAEALDAYEERFGRITADELADQKRSDRLEARVPRRAAHAKSRRNRSSRAV